MSNKRATRSNSSQARDMALVTPHRSVTCTRNNATTASSVSGVRKRQKATCFACGREGHKKTVCSFMEQNHPDVNLENIPWAEFVKGMTWASKNNDVLSGTQTLCGAPFAYVSTRK